MKLNQKGWGLQTMIIMVTILMFALIIIAVVAQSKFGYLFNQNEDDIPTKPPINSTKFDYSDLEKEVVLALKKYQKEYYDDILDGEKVEVKISTLQNKKYLDKLIDNKKNECTGYGIIKSKNDELTFNSYLKCGNDYKTKGYLDTE